MYIGTVKVPPSNENSKYSPLFGGIRRKVKVIRNLNLKTKYSKYEYSYTK